MQRPFKKAKIDVIVACDTKHGIGLNGGIPWKIPADMLHFKEITTKCSPGVVNAVIMGRRTWESIPKQFRPLAGRVNIVVSKTLKHTETLITSTFREAVEAVNSNVERIFAIGGREIYQEALQHENVENVYVTRVQGDFKCDVQFPVLPQETFQLVKYTDIQEEGALKFSFNVYVHKKTRGLGEYAYLSLLKNIIERGGSRQTRNATTLSLFGQRLEFDLREGFPLMTTRGRVWVRGVFEELMWIIRGDTNVKHLEAKGVKVWTPNSTREFLDKQGLYHLKESDVGPTYGFLMRHYGAEYKGCDKDYAGQGVDQLYRAINKIKGNPTDRRIIISLWDPTNEDKCALPPCLRDYQFYVDGSVLSCQATLRSSDVPVALHWNICTVGLLMLMLCKICGKTPGRLIMILGDAHIYQSHVEEVKKLLDRQPTAFPCLELQRTPERIEDFTFEDLRIVEYYPHTTGIKLEMIA